MNKSKVFILVGILVLLAGAAFVIFHRNSQTSVVISDTDSTTPVMLSVTPLAPAVYLKAADTQLEQQISASTTAAVGSVVRTSEKGRALIEGLSHKMVLDYGSQITLADEGAGHTSGQLTLGSVWSQIQKVFEKGEFYEIKTDNAVAAVRGTSFGVTRRGTATILFVTDGAVLFIPRDPKTGKEDPANAVLVKVGMKAVRNGSAKIVVVPITPADTKDEWFAFNNPLPDGPRNNSGTFVPVAPAETAPAKTPAGAAPHTTGGTPIGTGTQNISTGGAAGGGSSTAPASGLSIRSVSPARIGEASTEEVVTVTGTGFAKVATVLVGKAAIQDFNLVADSDANTASGSGTELNFFLPPEVAPGTYDISLVGTSGERVSLSQALTVYAN